MIDKRINCECSFQKDWLSIDNFKPWPGKVEGDKHSAKCCLFQNYFHCWTRSKGIRTAS